MPTKKSEPKGGADSAADTDVLKEARKLLEAERRAMQEADAKNPVLPSIINNSAEAARIVLDRFFTKNNLRQFAFYRDTWYSYYQKLWSERTESDIDHFLHNRLLLCRQIDKEGNVKDFNTAQRNVNEVRYQIQQLVNIPSHHNAPVALIDGKWKSMSAKGKMVCLGQIVDMRTEEIDDNHHLFIPNGAEWEYDAKAKAPKEWLKFLSVLFDDSAEEIALLQEWMGYVLSGDTWAHKGLILVGPPRAGKGVIGHVISMLLGKSMVSSPALHSLGAEFGLASLLDKRLCLISDARLSNRIDILAVVEVLLRITAQDSVSVNRKHKTSLQTELGARVMVLSNEMPQLSDNSYAINSRFLILSLQHSFLGREDTQLLDRLSKELPSIAKWCVKGYQNLLKRGAFAEPASSIEARSTWYKENNPIEEFIEDCCIIGADEKCSPTALYDAYQAWRESNGSFPLASNQLSRKLAATLGRKIRRSNLGGQRVIYGLGLKPTKI